MTRDHDHDAPVGFTFMQGGRDGRKGHCCTFGSAIVRTKIPLSAFSGGGYSRDSSSKSTIHELNER